MTPEDAIQRLYETPNLFEDLRDTEAQTLLRWAEAQVVRLAETTPDESAFDTRFDALGALIGQINRFVGQRHTMQPDARQTGLNDIMSAAVAIGLQPVPLQASISAQAADDDATALQSVLTMFAPADNPFQSPQTHLKANDEHVKDTNDTDALSIKL